jgi:hypothetical protein
MTSEVPEPMTDDEIDAWVASGKPSPRPTSGVSDENENEYHRAFLRMMNDPEVQRIQAALSELDDLEASLTVELGKALRVAKRREGGSA